MKCSSETDVSPCSYHMCPSVANRKPMKYSALRSFTAAGQSVMYSYGTSCLMSYDIALLGQCSFHHISFVNDFFCVLLPRIQLLFSPSIALHISTASSHAFALASFCTHFLIVATWFFCVAFVISLTLGRSDGLHIHERQHFSSR